MNETTPLDAMRCRYDQERSVQWPKLKTTLITTMPQGYRASCRAGELHVAAPSNATLATGIAQLMIALKSGHLEEYLGIRQPHYCWRILWSINETGWDATRLLALGYNAVVVDHMTEQTEALRQAGIAVGLKLAPPAAVSRCPLDVAYQQTFSQHTAATDFFCWESQLHHPTFTQHPNAESYTYYELLEAELRLLEQILPPTGQLIFYIPCDNSEQARQQAPWLSRLSDVVGPRTLIAFSCTSGDCSTAHPFWDLLRKKRNPSATPLLPLLNGGTLGLGEGLWPVLPIHTIDDCVTRMLPSSFAGAIIQAPHLPAGDGLLACGLWMASQALWSGRSAARLAETWFAAYQPENPYLTHAHAIAIAGEIAQELGRFSQAKGGVCTSAHIDVVAAKLRLLDSLYLTDTHTSPIQRYFHYFSRDAWCLLHYHTDRLRLPGPGVPHAVDHSGGFWTRLISNGSRIVPSAATVTPLDRPRCLADDPAMAHLFDLNAPLGHM